MIAFEAATLNQGGMQRLIIEDEAPVLAPGAFLLIRCDLAESDQQLTEMTDAEVFTANKALGGFD